MLLAAAPVLRCSFQGGESNCAAILPFALQSLCNACGIRFNKIRMGKRKASKEEEVLLRKYEHNLPPSHKYSAHHKAAAAKAAMKSVPVAAVHKARSRLHRHMAAPILHVSSAFAYDHASSDSEWAGDCSPAVRDTHGGDRKRKDAHESEDGHGKDLGGCERDSSGVSCLSQQEEKEFRRVGSTGPKGDHMRARKRHCTYEVTAKAEVDDVQYGAQLLMCLFATS